MQTMKTVKVDFSINILTLVKLKVEWHKEKFQFFRAVHL